MSSRKNGADADAHAKKAAQLFVRRGEPSSAKFEIPMYLGIFFWRQAAL
jgi:hypothetical protein